MLLDHLNRLCEVNVSSPSLDMSIVTRGLLQAVGVE